MFLVLLLAGQMADSGGRLRRVGEVPVFDLYCGAFKLNSVNRKQIHKIPGSLFILFRVS